MHELTSMIRADLKPSLGVTEPGAIAFCAALARSYLPGDLIHLDIQMNSGLYKNAFTCGVPNSRWVGAGHAAALGFCAGKPGKGLEALCDVTEEDDLTARRYVQEGKISTGLSGMSSRIYIRAALKTTEGEAAVIVRDSHTNVTFIGVNGEVLLEKPSEEETDSAPPLIHRYSFREILDYIQTVPYPEIDFVLEAHRMNLELFHEGLSSPRTVFARRLLAMNGGLEISGDERRTASLLCNGGIEARVIGLNKPAMSITGSGAHGIIATLPLYAVYKINRLTEEQLCRATMLSYLICTYIKEYSGRLSAFCGCGIAAGTGMAVAACWLKGGKETALIGMLNNMASSITGMICDGGNQGCVMKGVAACNAAFDSMELAFSGASVDPVHGINGSAPEETMRNMGRIASPGMTGTEETIVKIQEEKIF